MCRNHKADIIQYFFGPGTTVLKGNVFKCYIGFYRYIGIFSGALGFFVFPFVDFIQAFETYFGILRSLNKRNKLRQRGVQLANNILHGHHHPKGHASVNDRTGCQKRDHNIFCLVYKRTSHFLRLT